MESPAFVNFLSAYGFSFKPLPAGADLDHAVASLLAVTLHGLVALVDLHALDLPGFQPFNILFEASLPLIRISMPSGNPPFSVTLPL